MSRRIERPTVVLPQPDSPTRPSVLPGAMSKLTSSTAFTWPTVRESRPLRIGKYVLRLRTSTSGEPGDATKPAPFGEAYEAVGGWETGGVVVLIASPRYPSRPRRCPRANGRLRSPR